MKKNILYKSLLVLSISMVSLSCEKFLDDKPKTSLTTGNSYSTAKDIESVLTGCYNIFYGTDDE
jgi:hypothetical protein